MDAAVEISIHTTAKVVTAKGFWSLDGSEISIHTTAKVVTETVPTAAVRQSNFNPHHREGGDRMIGYNVA